MKRAMLVLVHSISIFYYYQTHVPDIIALAVSKVIHKIVSYIEFFLPVYII